MYMICTHRRIIIPIYTIERGATGSPVISTGGATDYTEYALTVSARITRVIKKKKKTNRDEGKKKKKKK